MTVDTGSGVAIESRMDFGHGVTITYQNGAVVTHDAKSTQYIDALECEVMRLKDRVSRLEAEAIG